MPISLDKVRTEFMTMEDFVELLNTGLIADFEQPKMPSTVSHLLNEHVDTSEQNTFAMRCMMERQEPNIAQFLPEIQTQS